MLKVSDMTHSNSNLELQLKKDYVSAKQNAAFAALVSKLKMREEILMKYTSQLEDGALEYGHCLECKGLPCCQNKIEGYAYLPTIKNDRLEFSYKACKFKEKETKETKYLKNVYYLDVPENIKVARMKDILTNDLARYDVIKYLKNFINDPASNKGLYLHGNFGCGKTYLITAAFNELAKKDVKSAIVFWPEFLKRLKSEFSGGFEEIINKVKKAPLLLIDDIGAENMTPWGRDEILCPILQYRMDENLKTFFTSNLNINELETHLSLTKDGVDIVKAKRIIERIKQLTTDSEMIGQNLRK